MTDALTIRPARREDAPTVLAFIQELAEYERLRDQCVAELAQVERTLFGNRPAAEVIIAELGGRPVGFALFFHNYSTFLAQPGIYLEDLYVRPDARGHGVGRRLLGELARLALARGCGRLEWAVLEWNEPAIGFYRSLGAREQSDWRTYRVVGDDLARLAD